MMAQFDLPKVHRTGAVFDTKKLNWYNAQYMKRLTPDEFRHAVGIPDLPDAAVPIMTERLERLSDAATFEYLWSEPSYEAALLQWKDDEPQTTRMALERCRELAGSGELTGESLDALAAESFGGKKGSVYWPLRVALSGRQNSAGPLDIARVIGPEATELRIRRALEKLP
jgi:glutamyl/glutaminyl-tRNA synthetase